jgi:hypothetical protein
MIADAVGSDDLAGPMDKMKQAAERNRHNGSNPGPVTTADSPQAMDLDPNSPTGATAPNPWDPHLIAAAAPAGSDVVDADQDQDPLIGSSGDQGEGAHASKKTKVTDPSSTDVILKVIGGDDNNPERLDARAPPAAASMRYQLNEEGTVTLPPAGAAMDDADDQDEDDDILDMQPGDYEYDDDVAAVSGDILGVGPTWGTVAGDPTSNLGGLGLAKHLQDSLGSAEGALAVPLVTPDSTTNGGTSTSDTGRTAGPLVTHTGTLGDSAAGIMSEGDADVRGRRVPAGVKEDADLPLRASAVGVAGPGVGEQGSQEGGMGLDTAEGEDDEYPEGFDGLDPGAAAQGKFRPLGPYIRHRAAGETGMDLDPRNRKTPDPRQGLKDIGALQGLGDLAVQKDVQRELGMSGGGSHPVEKGDFAMGTLAIPALADRDSRGVRGLEYTDEPKYAPEVDVGELEGPTEGLGNDSVISGAGHQGLAVSAGANGSSVAVGGANANVEGSGPMSIQQVETEGVQQRRVAGASAALPGADGSDARHLDAIFGR